MTEILEIYVKYAMSGFQEFCIACCVLGPFVMFARKLKDDVVRSFAPPKPKKKRTGKKSLQVQKPRKSSTQKPRTTARTWAKMPAYTPAELARIAEFQRRVDKSRGVKFDDNWTAYGVPL